MALGDKEIRHGDIYYIYPDNYIGSEQGGGRPAIVVSNDMGNRYAPIVSVVFLTTREKKAIPTHAAIQSTGRDSTALCEQVSTVSKERIGGFLVACSSDEMREVDRSLAAALGLRPQAGDIDRPAGEERTDENEIIAIRAEMNVYKRLYDRFLQMLMEPMQGGKADG